jgi:hypothetical protein
MFHRVATLVIHPAKSLRFIPKFVSNNSSYLVALLLQQERGTGTGTATVPLALALYLGPFLGLIQQFNVKMMDRVIEIIPVVDGDKLDGTNPSCEDLKTDEIANSFG